MNRVLDILWNMIRFKDSYVRELEGANARLRLQVADFAATDEISALQKKVIHSVHDVPATLTHQKVVYDAIWQFLIARKPAGVTPASVRTLRDLYYRLCSRKTWKESIRPKLSEALPYIIDHWDCDDHARDLENEVKKRFGIHGIGTAWGPNDAKLQGASHFANIIVFDDLTCEIIEPMTREFKDIEDPWGLMKSPYAVHMGGVIYI